MLVQSVIRWGVQATLNNIKNTIIQSIHNTQAPN